MKKASEPLFSDKLTKTFFMGLPESVYLVSNVCSDLIHPIFAENMLPEGLRLEQWKKITEVRVDQRLCRVFKNKAAHDRWNIACSMKVCKSK